MKRNELSVWAILIAASVAGSLAAAAIPDQEPKITDKQVKHASETGSDEVYAWVTTRSQTNSDASRAQRLAATKSY